MHRVLVVEKEHVRLVIVPAPPASGKLRRVRGHRVDRRLGQPGAALAVVRGTGLLLRAVAHGPRRALEHGVRVGLGPCRQLVDS